MGSRRSDGESIPVDHVHVRAHAHFERAAVSQAVEPRISTRLLLDHEFEGQALPSLPPSTPMHQLGREHRSVTDQVHVGAAIGETSHRDFRRLAASCEDLHQGGVVLNIGSAVIMPEVFLKALTVARNVNAGKPTHFTTADFDMQRHYRPRVNVVERPVLGSGTGYEITGHHEIMIPLLVWGIASQM